MKNKSIKTVSRSKAIFMCCTITFFIGLVITAIGKKSFLLVSLNTTHFFNDVINNLHF
jgi:hypothetical protein